MISGLLEHSSVQTLTKNHLNQTMQPLQLFVASLAVIGSALASPSETVNTDTKASSPLINCGCQCSSLTFRDAKGEVQGNCRTVDGTGAQWCYVDSAYSSCQDLVPSQRFPNNPWSYEACATPAPGSPLCPAVPSAVITPVAPSAVIVPAVETVPAVPVHHPEPVHHPIAPTNIAPATPVQQGPSFINNIITGQGIGPVQGGYDPESIGDIRQGDASSKSKLFLKN